MASLTASQLAGLDIASQRIKKGATYGGYATDLKNLNYAKSTYGYSYKPKSVLSPTTPIPATGLTPDTSNYDTLSKILGANVNSGMVSSDLAGLLALSGQDTQSKKQYDQLNGQLTDLMGQLGGQSADFQTQLDQQGVTGAYQRIKELNLRGAQLQGELAQFDAQTGQISADLGNQAIPTGLIQGQQAQLQQQRDLTRATKTSELASTAALSQAYQGNATIGLQLAQQAVDIKYAPMLNQINVLQQQIGIAKENMTADESKRASIINAIAEEQRTKLNEAKEKENALQSIAIEAATNGAPSHVVESIKMATNSVDAVRLAQNYLNKNVDFAREKELIRYRESFQNNNNGLTLQQASENPLLAFQAGGGRRIQKADGGFDFIAPDGRKITVEEAVNMTGMGAKADFLKGSGTIQDNEIIQGSSGKPSTMAQETTALYADRIKQSNDIFNTLEKYTSKLNPVSYFAQLKSPGFLNFLKSKDFQSLDQAQRNFVNAVLRRESGAVISPSEFENARLQYFPQPGDKPSTLKQKKANRDLVQKRFIQSSGNAYTGSFNGGSTQDFSGLEGFITQ